MMSAFVCVFISLIVNVLSFKVSLSNIGTKNLTERLEIDGDREYFIGVIETNHSYAPNAINPFDGLPVDDSESASVFTKQGIDRIGQTYIKAIYVQYNDSSFNNIVEPNDKWAHLGVLGPAIRGVVGERIKIVFKNMGTVPYSMHPHGVQYDKTSEGALYQDPSLIDDGDSVGPGETWVYFWDVRYESGGSYNELSSKLWFYHSHVDEPMDTNSGLVGPLIVTKSGMQTGNDNLMPKDVDREFVTLFTVFDENLSHYLKENVYQFATGFNLTENGTYPSDTSDYDALIEDGDFQESNLMHSMNGLLWGVLGRYYTGIKLGERVRWYVGALGTEVDLHSVHWHGNTVLVKGRYEDVTQLIPAITQTMDMIPDQAGKWVYHCHVNDHIHAGMLATYTVTNETADIIRTPPNNPLTIQVDELQSQIDTLMESQQITDNNDDWDWIYALKIAALASGFNFIIIIIAITIFCACKSMCGNDNKSFKRNSVQKVASTDQYLNMQSNMKPFVSDFNV